MKKLPNKPSKLLELALKDLRAVEADGRYIVDMCTYHNKRSKGGKCHVCLAGAVMAKSLKAKCGESYAPYSYEAGVRDQLFTLKCFCDGVISFGLLFTSTPIPPDLPDFVGVTPYEESPSEFKRDMKKIIKLLKKAGL